DQIGVYVNTVPLCATVDPEQSFAGWLSAVSEDSFRTFEFQDYPFDKIIDDLSLPRDTSRNPLFDILMVLQDNPGGHEMEMRHQFGFTLDLLDKFLYPSGRADDDAIAAKIDLTFNFDHQPDKTFYLEVEYDTRLFSRLRIAAFCDAFGQMAGQVLKTPEIKVKEIEWVGDEGRRRILEAYNRPVEGIEELSIPAMLREPLRRYADRTAIVSDGQRISYGELEALSKRIGRRLAAAGASGLVGVLMDRSEWMIPCLLGIWESGAGYVPIDPAYPASRIGYMLEDAKPSLLVTDARCAGLVPAGYSGRVIELSSLLREEGDAVESLREGVDWREETAYVIYTSGSTGRPKGVDICHRNTIAFLRWAMEEFRDTSFEIVYAVTSYCFDLSVFEFFFPLLTGRAIRMLGSGMEIGKHLGEDEGVLLNTVPSVVKGLLEEGIDWRRVSAVNMAGEALPRRLREELLAVGGMELRNLYGPTEDTTYSTVHRFEWEDHGCVPIGRPVGYTQLYILDEYGRLVPEGMEGEICLSGQSVAKGYWGRADLTAERFVPNPFVTGLRMYRTGDMGRWLPDGQVEFRGRRDQQVKIRGHRIELAEIEYQLEQQAGVSQAVVKIWGGGEEAQLAAYWTGEELSEAVLRTGLQELLPAYMIPSVFLRLETMPLNNNGKVDRNQLPPPVTSAPGEPVTEPRNTTEKILLSIWKEVLKIEQIGMTDDFFQKGGHSLKATRLKALVATAFGKELTLNDIFTGPTIAQQAALLDSRMRAALPAIIPSPRADLYPISFSQERLWVLTRLEEASSAYHMPAAFRIIGRPDIDRLLQAFRCVIEKYEILRTTFTTQDGVPLQVIRQPAEIDFNIREVILEDQQELADVFRQQWSKPFDLEKGPLLDCFILVAKEERFLSFNMHHIISDGWSLVLLYKDMMAAYRDLAAGGVGRLSHPDVQYKDFAVWQRSLWEEGRRKEESDFWKRLFADEAPVLTLPLDFPRPPVKTYKGAVVQHIFSSSFMDDMNRLSVQEGVSLFMILISGVALLLGKYAGQNDLVIGTPVSGRDHPQLQDQIGFFVNTLPIRINIDESEDVRSLLRRQKQMLLQAFDCQAFPFDRLVESLQLKKELSRSLLFDVMVVLQNMDGLQDEDMSGILPGLQLERVNVDPGIAKYDLSFIFSGKGRSLGLQIEYNTNLFRASTIDRMIEGLELLFTQVLRDITL
ncbi:MAG TPA: amino acid adenylation domain-containing protein, partial [Puia sp.]|nr:amino acid adenylation domain-containing protein [Puia sp.]